MKLRCPTTCDIATLLSTSRLPLLPLLPLIHRPRTSSEHPISFAVSGRIKPSNLEDWRRLISTITWMNLNNDLLLIQWFRNFDKSESKKHLTSCNNFSSRLSSEQIAVPKNVARIKAREQFIKPGGKGNKQLAQHRPPHPVVRYN